MAFRSRSFAACTLFRETAPAAISSAPPKRIYSVSRSMHRLGRHLVRQPWRQSERGGAIERQHAGFRIVCAIFAGKLSPIQLHVEMGEAGIVAFGMKFHREQVKRILRRGCNKMCNDIAAKLGTAGRRIINRFVRRDQPCIERDVKIGKACDGAFPEAFLRMHGDFRLCSSSRRKACENKAKHTGTNESFHRRLPASSNKQMERGANYSRAMKLEPASNGRISTKAVAQSRETARLIDIQRNPWVMQNVYARAAALGFRQMLQKTVRPEMRRKQTWRRPQQRIGAGPITRRDDDGRRRRFGSGKNGVDVARSRQRDIDGDAQQRRDALIRANA